MSASLDTPPSALDSLGGRIRELRTARGITLAELSAQSQVSVAMLSHIERGQATPSLKTLERLRVALHVELAAFFEGEQKARQSNEAAITVNRQARPSIPFAGLGLTKELLSPPGHSALEMLMLVIEPGGSSGLEPWTRNGEKAGYVLDGGFELTVGERRHVLQEGDSFQFDSRRPHWFRNLSEQTTRVLWIIKSDAPA